MGGNYARPADNMKPILSILAAIALTTQAAGPSGRAISFTWKPNAADLGGMSEADYATNITFVLYSSTDCTIPLTNWPSVASWPASQFISQGPCGSTWISPIPADGVTRFYALRTTNQNGQTSFFSEVAVWLPASLPGTISALR